MLAADRISPRPYFDILRTRSGASVTVRLAEPDDAAGLKLYFASLSWQSRYSRLMGAVSEISARELYRFSHVEPPRYPLVLTSQCDDGREVILGEGLCFVHDDSGRAELALSVSDDMQRCGIGTQLLASLERRAIAVGARGIFGETLRSNAAMLGLARKLGYHFNPVPGDWKLVRFEKQIDLPKSVYPGIDLPKPVYAGVSRWSALHLPAQWASCWG